MSSSARCDPSHSHAKPASECSAIEPSGPPSSAKCTSEAATKSPVTTLDGSGVRQQTA